MKGKYADLADELYLAVAGEKIADDLESWFNGWDYKKESCEEPVRSDLMAMKLLFHRIAEGLREHGAREEEKDKADFAARQAAKAA